MIISCKIETKQDQGYSLVGTIYKGLYSSPALHNFCMVMPVHSLSTQEVKVRGSGLPESIRFYCVHISHFFGATSIQILCNLRVGEAWWVVLSHLACHVTHYEHWLFHSYLLGIMRNANMIICVTRVILISDVRWFGYRSRCSRLACSYGHSAVLRQGFIL